jgi:hypothetical protein
LINKILKEIKKNNVGLISCIINYIKENLFDKHSEKNFEFLEIDKDINNKIDLDIIKKLADKIL